MSDIFPVKVDIKADLTKPAEDVTGMLKDSHKGVGKLIYAAFGPWIEERVGKAKRVAAQAEKDSLDILAGRVKLDEEAKTLISIGDVSNIDALCEELETVNSKCKAKRLASALRTAAIEMKQVPENEVSDEPLNQTFFNHWREEAELIDDEYLRQWWAHLLVEETKTPNSISPRTLDVAKNLSQREAKLFVKLSPGIIAGKALIVSHINYAPVDGDHNDIKILQEAGLIEKQYSHLMLRKFSNPAEEDINKNAKFPFPAGGFIIVTKNKNIGIICYTLTMAGRELFKLIASQMLSDEQIQQYVSIIKSCYKGCEASFYRDSDIRTNGLNMIKLYFVTKDCQEFSLDGEV